MRSLVRSLATMAALTVSPVALAGLGPNGLGPNGLGPNGLGPNGLGPNGLGPNGLGPNGLGPNGLGPNGLLPNGLGPNGLGPNGLGPNGLNVNGLDVNGLGPNGLGSNGLGPNGLVYRILPDGSITDPSTFAKWFEADTASASQFMKYFTRCAYDGQTAIAYLDSTGKTWIWVGRFGLAMGSFRSVVEDPVLGPIRGRMTADEGKWVSSCLLVHVNTQGTHQYLSMRGNPPNVEAQQALFPMASERWLFSELGWFFGDLFHGSWDASGHFVADPKKYSQSSGRAPLGWVVSGQVALGRGCDLENCTYGDPAAPIPVLTQHFAFGDQNLNGHERLVGVQTDPDVGGDTLCYEGSPYGSNGSCPMGPAGTPMPPEGWADFHPLTTFAPRLADFEGYVGTLAPVASSQGWEPGTPRIRSSGIPIAPEQIATCAAGECIGLVQPFTPRKVTGLVDGQILDVVTRNDPRLGDPAVLTPPIVLDPTEAYTAFVRYANPKGVNAAARIQASTPTGAWRDAGTEVWNPTTATGGYDWMYVYPVHLFPDAVDNAGNLSMRVRISGAAQGEQCSGAKKQKGDGETGTCNLKHAFFDWKHLKVACGEAGESPPPCRGELILDYRNKRWGWFCAYGGKPVYACTAADAPELDAAAFIPGKPYCMPDGATSFVGTCR
jgi:hypothetical protein